jgi:hypothetical protein
MEWTEADGSNAPPSLDGFGDDCRGSAKGVNNEIVWVCVCGKVGSDYMR